MPADTFAWQAVRHGNVIEPRPVHSTAYDGQTWVAVGACVGFDFLGKPIYPQLIHLAVSGHRSDKSRPVAL